MTVSNMASVFSDLKQDETAESMCQRCTEIANSDTVDPNCPVHVRQKLHRLTAGGQLDHLRSFNIGQKIRVVDNIGYITNPTRLFVQDFSDPFNPIALSSYDQIGFAGYFVGNGDICWYIDKRSFWPIITTLAIDQPTMTVLATGPIGGTDASLEVRYPNLLVPVAKSIDVYDNLDPLVLEQVFSIDLNEKIANLRVQENHVYGMTASGALVQLDSENLCRGLNEISLGYPLWSIEEGLLSLVESINGVCLYTVP